MIVQHTQNYATTETYMLTCDKCWGHVTTEFRGFQSRNFDVHGKNEFTHLSVNRLQCNFKSLKLPQIILRLSILVEIGCGMTILQQVKVVVFFMPYFRSIATHTVSGYHTNMKLISRGFQYVSAKYK